MSTDKYGPGSNPELHEGGTSYCYTPVVAAKFIPASEDVRPPLRLYLLIYEVKSQVFGQVLSERRFREFEDLPHLGPDPYPRSKSLEFESKEGYDPLQVLWDTLTGLQQTAARIDDVTPILFSVNVISAQYVELGVDLVKEFGTPLASLRGYISQADVVPLADCNDQSMAQEDDPTVRL